jgi:hypothetical protein
MPHERMSMPSNETAARSSGWWTLAAASGLLVAALAARAAYVETPTVDEFAHVPAGCVYLKYGDFHLYAKNPPLMKCLMAMAPMLYPGVDVPPPQPLDSAWAPWVYGQQFMMKNAASYFKVFFSARLVVIAAGLLTAMVLYLWAKGLFGERAAAIATALFCLDPTVLAHAHLATVDAGCMLTVLLTIFALRWARRAPSWPRVAVVGMVFGLALLVKFTAMLLLPVLVVLIAAHRGSSKLTRAGHILVMVVCATLVVNIVMGFKGSFRPLAEFPLVSSFGKSLQSSLPGALPVPVPRDYLLGFDAQKLDTEQGEFGSYLLGRWSPAGFWSYNFVALAVKTPIWILLILASSPWFLARARLPRWEWMLILVPLVWLMSILTVFSRLNIGVRYLLPLYPLLYLLVAAVWARASWLRGWIAPGVVLAIGLATALWTHPNYLAYFNVLAGGSRHGHRVLIDSNLDWGQDLYRLKPALEKMGIEERIGLLYFGHVNPALYGIDYRVLPPMPVKGVVAVSVNYLMGYPYPVTTPAGEWIDIGPTHAAWLRRHEPTVRLESIWIYDLRER